MHFTCCEEATSAYLRSVGAAPGTHRSGVKTRPGPGRADRAEWGCPENELTAEAVSPAVGLGLGRQTSLTARRRDSGAGAPQADGHSRASGRRGLGSRPARGQAPVQACRAQAPLSRPRLLVALRNEPGRSTSGVRADGSRPAPSQPSLPRGLFRTPPGRGSVTVGCIQE